MKERKGREKATAINAFNQIELRRNAKLGADFYLFGCGYPKSK